MPAASAPRSIVQPRSSVIVLAIGVLSMAIPTILSLASEAWTKDQGVHGPIVLATGLWLIWRRWGEIVARAIPGSPILAFAGLLGALLLYALSRAFDFLSVETFALILAVLAIAYSFVGLHVLQSLWFPIFYLLFLVQCRAGSSTRSPRR